MLLLFKGDFTIEPTGMSLERINKANMITLFRLSTLPTIFFIILASKDYPMRYELIALVAIIFATDFLDGYISRRDKETTRVGKMMDSASDYALLFVISIVFHYFHIIPQWFMVLIIFRLAAQGVMVLMVLAVKKRVTPKTSFLGKAAVASTMILYAIELLRFVLDIHPTVYTVLEYIAGGIVAISVGDKVLLMKSDLATPSQGSTKNGRLNPVTDGERNGTNQERA
jgi:CDP-diacylglycerol--glycerol-3-phosphate 3-phosphatidyltransferase